MRITFTFIIIVFSLATLQSTKHAVTANETAASLRCYDGSFETYSVFSLSDAVSLLNSSCYNPERKTVFYTFGFYGEATGHSAKAIVEAHLTLPYNVILVNWENQASGSIFGSYLGYLRAVHNAVIVGQQFGQTLIKLIGAGLEPLKIHLIGFSLGASFMGYAAREVQKLGQNITRVTGLDPPRPFFDGPGSLRGLDASSATFVMIIHTNPGAMGTVQNYGTVDIWPNCGNSTQPGCAEVIGDGGGIMSLENKCSHDRSWRYFAEALKNPNSFIARRATDCTTWSNEGETISLGDNIPFRTRGIFFLNTNSTPFYGRGEAGSIPDI